jgi:transcriptional regulator with XRE-family HTH domain
MTKKDFGRPRNALKDDSVGARIRAARLRAGYKRASDLARDAGITQSTISQLENGVINPLGKKTLSTMINLVRLLNDDFGESSLTPFKPEKAKVVRVRATFKKAAAKADKDSSS